MLKIAFNIEGMVNVAVGKPTLQSSTHPASVPFSLKGAVTGNPTPFFGFQTKVEVNPWWTVDLGQEFQIDTIVIYNRNDDFADKSADTVVLISVEGDNWLPVCSCSSLYGGARDHRPLVIFLAGERFCRYVRVEHKGSSSLSLAEVQVWCRKSHFLLAQLFSAKGFSLARNEGSYAEASVLRAYDLERFESDGDLAGVKIYPFGRFGNNIIQLLHAVDFAETYNLLFVDARKLEFPDILVGSRLIEADKVYILLQEEGLPVCQNKTVLAGNFWDLRFSHCGTDRRREGLIIKKYLQKLFRHPSSLGAETLVMHVRSGDVFALASPHPGYGQPPLSYYIKSIKHRQENYGIEKVVVVYEDSQNPVVGGLKKHFESVGLHNEFITGALAYDISMLMSAQHLVLSNGTFPLVCGVLSANLKTVIHFRDQSMLDWFEPLNVRVDIVYDDNNVSFTAPNLWTGSKEQIDLISTYNEDLLSIRMKPQR